MKWFYRINRPRQFVGRLQSVSIVGWRYLEVCTDPYVTLEGTSTRNKRSNKTLVTANEKPLQNAGLKVLILCYIETEHIQKLRWKYISRDRYA